MPETSFLTELKRRNILKVAAAYTVASWIVLQIADIVFPVLGLTDQHIGHALAILTVGFPFVVGFAWFYEITPDGLMPTRRVSPHDSISQETGRRINQMIIALLSIALAFFMFEYFSRPDSPITNTTVPGQVPTGSTSTNPAQTVEPTVPIASEVDPTPSIAVMPFVNMSSDAENEYFSDGLSEELLNVLAQVDGLRVAGRTSSFFYKGKNIDLRDIGRELDVDNILEGSVRKAGERVRITAQLISTEDGFHLWSQTYDRQLNDIFAIQDEIAGEVAGALQLTLLDRTGAGIVVSDAGRTANAEAHDVYLQAKQLLYDRRPENVLRSIDLFKLATSLDPEYAAPWLGYADATMIAWNNHRSVSLEASIKAAEEAFDQVEHLGKTGGDYWASRGLYHSHLSVMGPDNDSHYQQAIEAFEQALDYNPNNVSVLHWYATTLRGEGTATVDRERELMERAMQLDPHNRVVKMNYYMSMVGTEDEDRGIEGLERMADLDRDYDGYDQYLSSIHINRNRFVEAARHMGRLDDDNRFRDMVATRIGINFLGKEMASRIRASVNSDPFWLSVLRRIDLSLNGSRQQLVTEARLLLNDPGPEFPGGDAVARGLLRVGEAELAVRVLEHTTPALTGKPSTTGIGSLDVWMAALWQAGESERAQRWAHHVLEEMGDRTIMGVFRGRGTLFVTGYMVLGEIDSAIAELEQAYQEGWRELNLIGINDLALFAPLRDDEQVRALRERIEADLDVQRSEVLAAMAWHPAFASYASR